MNVSSAFQVIQKFYAHFTKLCLAVVCKFFGDFWGCLGRESFSQRISKIWRNIEINLELPNLVQIIPHESTNGGPSTQRTCTELHRSAISLYLLVYLVILIIFFHNKRTFKSHGGGGGGVRTHPSHPLPTGIVC